VQKREGQPRLPPLNTRMGLTSRVLLWGICQHEVLARARDWLRNHPDLEDVVRDAKAGLIRNGVLYSEEGKSLARRQIEGIAVPEAAQSQVDRVLEACIHLALCGPVGSAEFRGNAPRSRRQTTERKQTVATHLRHLFIDTMRLYSLRCMEPQVQAQPMAETKHWTQSATQKLNPAAPLTANSIEDLDEKLKPLLKRLESVNPLAVPWESDLERAIRSDDIEKVKGSLVLAVAFFQVTGMLPESVRTLISRLTNSDEPTLAQAARWAVDRLRKT